MNQNNYQITISDKVTYIVSGCCITFHEKTGHSTIYGEEISQTEIVAIVPPHALIQRVNEEDLK